MRLQVTRLLAEATGRPPGEIGFFRARPPLKPLTIGELAALDTDADTMARAE